MSQTNTISILQKGNKIKGIWLNEVDKAEAVTEGLNNFALNGSRWSCYSLCNISIEGNAKQSNDNVISVLIDTKLKYTIKAYINDELKANMDKDRLNVKDGKPRYAVETFNEWVKQGEK